MKLYNRTKCHDSILEKIILRAGKLVGARTTNVVVQVNTASNRGVGGVAQRCEAVRMGRKGNQQYIKTDGGYFKITLPKNKHFNPIDVAMRFFKVACHEFVHIADYQAIKDGETRTFSRGMKRRPKHDYRPEEIRANCMTKEVENYYNEDDILELAIWIEENQK